MLNTSANDYSLFLSSYFQRLQNPKNLVLSLPRAKNFYFLIQTSNNNLFLFKFLFFHDSLLKNIII